MILIENIVILLVFLHVCCSLSWALLSFSGILFSTSIWYGLLVSMPDELLENDVDKFAVSQIGQIHVQLVACMTL